MGIERKIEKLIQNQNAENRERILEKLHENHPELNAKPQQKRFPSFSWRRIAVSACMACLLICAIIIPSVVFVSGNNENNIPVLRYCSINDYSLMNIDSTIKQFSQNNDANMMYFDWYETVDDCATMYYSDNRTKEILGFRENMFVVSPHHMLVELNIVYKNIALEGLSIYIESCKEEWIIAGTIVKWNKSLDDMCCTFVNGDYTYLITLYYEQDENLLFKLVEELLE